MTDTELSSVLTREDLAAALTRLRDSAGLSIRALARTVHSPPSTVGGYFGGRHLPPPGELRRLLLACGVEPDHVEPWLEAARRVRAGADRRISRTRPPYRGLEPFDIADADLFHGRDAVVAQILALVTGGTPMVAVVGASGSGKSSILRAGVVPRLRAAGVTCAVVTPGDEPLATLDTTADVLVVDQFEEVFTRAPAWQRASFLDGLADTLERGRQIVFGLRSDFYADAAGEPALVTALQDAQVLVGAMSEPEMRAAITAPATVVGVDVDEALVDLLVAELRPRRHAEAGALPLLSHALLASWEHCVGPRLTVTDYRRTGGVDVAVQRTAEEVYDALEPPQQRLARRIFLRLVMVDGDVAVTRRSLSWDELDALDTSGQGAEIVGRFVDRRLLTAGEDHVEISHEALLTAWPRLRDWIGEDRAVLRLQRQISEAANDWHEHRRDPAMLWRGVRLDEATHLRADPVRAAELTTREQEFVDAASALTAVEASRESRRANRFRTLLAVSMVLLVVAVTLGVYAQRSRLAAESAQRGALSRQVAGTAVLLRQTDAALAEQLILAAYRIAPTSVAQAAMIDASASNVITRVLGRPGPTPLAVTRNGGLLAVADAEDGSIRLYRSHPPSPPTFAGVVSGSRPLRQQYALAFSPDGRTLAAGGQGGQVRLWDVSNPSRPAVVATLTPASDASVRAVAFSPDGGTVLAASAGVHPVQAWDVRDRAAPRALTTPPGIPSGTQIHALAFDRSGRLAAGGTGGTVYVWPAASGAAPVHLSSPDTVEALVFDPRRSVLYVGDAAGRTRVWTLGTTASSRPSVTASVGSGSNGPVTALAVSPDGRRVAVGVSAGSVTQWATDAPDGPALTNTPGSGPVSGLAYRPDGTFLFITTGDGTLRVRSSSRSGIPVDGTAYSLAYDRSLSRLAVFTSSQDGVRLWDPRTGYTYGAPLRVPGGGGDGAGTMTADGSLVAAGDLRGRVTLWNTADAAHPRLVSGPLSVVGGRVDSIAVDPAGDLLAVSSDDGTIAVLDIRDPRAPRRVSVVRGGASMNGVAFSRDGRLLAGANADRNVYLWDVSTPAKPMLTGRIGGFASEVRTVSFSPAEDILAAAGADQTVRLWDVGEPSRLRLLGPVRGGPSDIVYAIGFSPDGTRFAVGSNDKTVRVYRVHSGRDAVPDLTLQQPNAPVWAVVFSPDGKSLTSGGRDITLSTWTLDPSVFAKQLCAAAGDPITRFEWALYVPGAKYDPPCR